MPFWRLTVELILKNTKIIQLGETRELLSQWNEVKAAILAGQVTGLHAGVQTTDGTTVFLAGTFRDDPMQAVRTMLKAAAESTKRITACMPAFRASRM